MPTKLRTRAFGLTSLVRPKGLSNPWQNFAIAHTAWIKGSKEIAGLMLMATEPEIQQNLETLHAHEILLELKTLLAQQAEQELLQTTRYFHSYKQEEGQSVSSYVLKMKGYIDNLERLGNPVTLGLGVSLILISLRKEFDGLVQNYNMHSLRKTINELHDMLKLHEQTLPKKNAPALHAIRVGNGQREAVEVIGIFYLCLPSGLEIVLNNCHYAPSITRRVISVSHLYEDGFINRFVNNTIQVSRNNMVYFSVIPRDGIFEIDLSNSYTNESSIYAVSNKKAKLDLDSALLWHCHLGHISKKRIEKLQHDELLNSTDLQAFEKCVPCMSGKMARKPYTHQVERAKYLLGLIHTDVCGPFKIMSRQGASYFVTFTDDFSRYGYVYLLKHKHEVFETFKVIQKEVENQLGKTIKSLHFDRGGEYMSQEFLDHLKDHGIIAHQTPPYTPQHNGYPKEMMSYSFYYPPENKVLVAQNAEFLENSLITQEASGILEDLEIIQEENTHPSIDTSLNHEEDDLEIYDPQIDIIPIRRSTRTRHAPDRMCLYIDAEEHKLGDLGELANYKAALLDPDVSSKWLFKKKTDMDEVIHTYKARLVAKGYTQTPWIDYEETFSLVYMEQPKGFVNPKYPNRKFGFTQNRDEPCVYLKAIGSNITFLIFYVDDILIMGNNIPMLQGVKSYLGRCFAMKDLGEAAYILGIKIYRDRSRPLIGLCQSAYIEKILKRYCMENSKRGSIPMQEKLKLSKSQGSSIPAELKRMKNVPYASTVVSIMYVVRCTRLDAVFAQNVTSRFQQNPGDLHWTTVKNILKYLRNTKDMFLTGYVFILNGGVVDWKNAKQSIFATSSAKAEYIATFDASKEAVWVWKFISRLGVVPTIEEPISMYYDNTEAITIANESGITKGARYFHAKVHYLPEVIEYGDVKLEKVHTDDNLADPFTKALAFPKHSEHTRNIGMLPASSLI
nr:hypothetical protein [Tanacetum cinerariifolium]